MAAIRAWIGSLAQDTKRARPAKLLDSTLLSQQGKWLDAPDVFASELDTLQAGTIFPMMFGHVGTIRSSCVISMQSPKYKVASDLPADQDLLQGWSTDLLPNLHRGPAPMSAASMSSKTAAAATCYFTMTTTSCVWSGTFPGFA